jgi:hypothetical protein
MTSKEFEEQVKIAKNIAVKANDMSLIDGVFLKGFLLGLEESMEIFERLEEEDDNENSN